MKKMQLILLTLLAGSLTLWAGEEGEHHKCSADTQACLNKLAGTWETMAWDGIHVEGLGTGESLKVTDVVANSPGAKAGIQNGDLLLTMDGKSLGKMSNQELIQAMKELAIGSTATYIVQRDGHKREIPVTMSAAPKEFVATMIGKHMMYNHRTEEGSNF